MYRTLDSLSSIGMMGRLGPKRYRPIARRLHRMNEAFYEGRTDIMPNWTTNRWAEAFAIAAAIDLANNLEQPAN